MVNARGLLVVILSAIALIAVCAHARAKAAEPLDEPCAFIRAAVRVAGGLDAAIQEARRRGYSQDYIEATIKRCRLR